VRTFAATVAAALVLAVPWAFGSETNWMSPCGYMRWQRFQLSGAWGAPLRPTQVVIIPKGYEVACNP